MAEAEFFRFHEDQYLEVEVYFGNPSKEERIVFHRDERIRTPASIISQIFWEDPGAFRRLTENLRDLNKTGFLNPARTSLVVGATIYLDSFIQAANNSCED